MNQPRLQRLDCASLDRYFSDLVAFAVDADHFPLKIYVSKFESSNLSPAESSTQTEGKDHGIPRTCGALVLHTGVKQRSDLVT
jgi:hypothetical protein